MKSFLLALQFLTRIPVSIKGSVDENHLKMSVLYFPIVGILIGGMLTAIAQLEYYLPYRVAMVIVIASEAALTGALHIDGFADTCDGFSGGRDKNRILEIMRDSRIGSIGALGLTILLLLKLELLSALPRTLVSETVFIMPVFSRSVQVLICRFTQYARKEGKAKYFIGFKENLPPLFAVIIVLSCCYVFFENYSFSIIGIASAPVIAFVWRIKNKIDGMTGDTIGASNEISEITLVFTVLVLSVIGIL